MMLAVAIELALAAGQLAREAVLSPADIAHKGPRDIVTAIDVAAQRAIVAGIQARFPHHAILAEEEGFDRTPAAEWLWIIDPIDGTTNFARGMPSFCVSIGLYHEGAPYLGVVYDPTRDHLFHAQRGEGAWFGRRRLQVSRVGRLEDALIGHDWARSPTQRRRLVALIERLSCQAHALRAFGTAALGLCYVAAGWLDAFINLELRIWDVAAGGLLIEEAGGHVSAFDGSAVDLATRDCLATNGLLHPLIGRLSPQRA